MDTLRYFRALKPFDTTWKVGVRCNSFLKSLAIVSFTCCRHKSTIYFSNASINHSDKIRVIQLTCDDVIFKLVSLGQVAENVSLESAYAQVFFLSLTTNDRT